MIFWVMKVTSSSWTSRSCFFLALRLLDRVLGFPLFLRLARWGRRRRLRRCELPFFQQQAFRLPLETPQIPGELLAFLEKTKKPDTPRKSQRPLQ
jgi:hypothetical protein